MPHRGKTCGVSRARLPHYLQEGFSCPPAASAVLFIYPCGIAMDCQGPPAGQCIAKGSSERMASRTGPMKDCIRTPMSSNAMGGGFNSPPWRP